MKVRIDFVSNSSSSSFVIEKKFLNKKQIDQIVNHIEYARPLADQYGYEICLCPWNIKITEKLLLGSTDMDNFDMHWFLEKIGVSEEVIEWLELN